MAGINLSALSDYFKYPEKVAELRVRLYKILVDKNVEVDANASLNTLIDKVREVEGNIEENTIYITENNTTEGYDVTNYTKAIVDVQAQVEENELDKLLDNTIESFIMPQSINYLGPYKFYQCTYLSEIQANSLMNIENHVFYGCSNLENANLPYVTSIGYRAFAHCTSLQELSVPELVDLGSEALQNVQNLTKLDFPNLVRVTGGSNLATTVTSSVYKASYLSIPFLTTIPGNCFYGLKGVSSIYAPNLVSTQGGYAIDGTGNSNLSALSFPLLTTIYSSAITSFPKVKTIDAPLVSLVGFNYMPEVSRVSFPYLRQFSPWAFYGFNSLEEADFPYLTGPAWVSWGMSSLFINCYSLSRVSLPRLTSAEFYDSFSNCSSLTEIEFPLLGYGYITSYFLGNTPVERISMPRFSSGYIYSAFSNKTTLKYVNLNNFTSLSSSMFINDIALESVDILNTQVIGSSAFFGCNSLKEIYFTGHTIYTQAFANCTSLSALYLLNAERVTLYGSVFLNTPFMNSNLLGEYGKIYVPSSLYSSYISASFWSELTSAIASMPSEIENKYILANQLDVSILEQESKSSAEVILRRAFANTAISRASHSTIKQIERDAFLTCQSLAEIDFPAVEDIGISAFANCTKLASISLPNVKYIGQRAFQTTSLRGTLDLPEVLTIDRNAFSVQSYLSSLNAPKVEYIAASAFYNCSTLSQLNLPNVELIDYSAFYYCFSLKSIDLPKAKIIGSEAFYNCSYLSEISLPQCKVIERGAFYRTSISQLNLPEAEVIQSAFSSCSYLKTVSAPKAKILTGTFSYCHNLSEVYAPELKIIGEYAFQYCSSLASIYAPKVVEIGDGAFSGVSSLTEVNFSNVRLVKRFGFYNCLSLSYVSLPELRMISESAFAYCYKLTSIYAPHLTYLSGSAFLQCSLLSEIPNQSKLTKIPTSCFAYCSSLTEVDLPVCSNILNGAFASCRNLSSISIPQVKELGAAAFMSCYSLQSISNNFIKSIYQNTFNQCSNISSIYLPRVSSIGSYAFSSCSNLTNLTVDFSKLSVIEEYTFAGCEKLDIFSTSSYWSNVTEIRGGAFSNCKYLNSIINTNQSYIYDFTYNGTNIYEINNSHITSIGISAFAENSQLSNVILENCSFIGSSAFKGCTNLTNIQLSSSYTYLGQYAFADTKISSIDSAAKQRIETSKYVTSGLYKGTEISEINLEGIEDVYLEAFRSCNNLTNLSLSTVTSIANYGFANCENLGEIFLPSINYLGYGAFSGCRNLSNINLPLDLSNISFMEAVFQNCDSIESFDFRNAKTVTASMFANCQNLVSLNMENIQFFSGNAVANCSKLESIYLPVCASIANIGANMYQNNKALRTVWTPLSTYITDGINYQNLPNLREVLTPGYYMNRGNYIGCTALESFYLLTSNSSIFSGTYSSYWANTPITNSTYLGYYGSFYVFSKWWSIMSRNISYRDYWISERIASLPDAIERQFLHAYELSNVTEIPENKLNVEYIIGNCPSSQFTLSSLSLSKVKLINNGAFTHCSTLTEINFPEAKILGYNAFGYCFSLSSIYLPQVIDVSEQCFARNSALTELNLPNVEIVRSYAFSGCSNLSEINLPKIQSIYYSAFQWCSKINRVNLPSIKFIGGNAFYNCYSVSEIYLSFQGSSAYFAGMAFANCSSLKNLTLNFTNGLIRTGNYETQHFMGCYSIENINIIGSKITPTPETNGGTLSRWFTGASAENLYANDLTSGAEAYQLCYNFKVKNIEMNSLDSLPAYACSHNSWLERASFKKIKSLGIFAFYNCNKLPYIEFPNLTKLDWYTYWNGSIASSTFTNCTHLSIIVFGASKMVSFSASYLYNSCFNNTPITDSNYLGYYGSFYVPASLLAAYMTDSRWGYYPSRFTTIEANLTMLQALGLCSNYGTSSYWE